MRKLLSFSLKLEKNKAALWFNQRSFSSIISPIIQDDPSNGKIQTISNKLLEVKKNLEENQFTTQVHTELVFQVSLIVKE